VTLGIKMKTRANFVAAMAEAKRLSDREYFSPKALPRDLGIGGSTFRAYQRAGVSPSRIFRAWVDEEGKTILSSCLGRGSRSAFLKIHKRLTESWAAYWNSHAKRQIRVCEKYKAVDLYLKAIAFSGGHEFGHLRESLYRYGNTPLDKFSLGLVRNLFVGIVLSRQPSMGDIEDEESYWFLQRGLHASMRTTGTPNMAFDFYAWDHKHSNLPNHSPDPTPLAVTPAAAAPVAPAGGRESS